MPRDQDQIARRAYAIWEAEGRPEGRADEHWTQAEGEAEDEDRAPLSSGEPAADATAPSGPVEGAGEGDVGEASESDAALAPELGGRGQRVEDDGESEAVLQDGDGAGRPGSGIYSGP